MSRSTPVQDLVAVIPAAGSATRVTGLPFSKCLYPLPVSTAAGTTVQTPLGRLLDGMQQAGVARAVMVNRHQRSDVMEYVTDRSRPETFPVAHVVTSPTPSVPHTILRAVPFVGYADVLLAYPDIVFEPMDLPAMLAARKVDCAADIMLALVATDRPDKSDTVELNADNSVLRISIKSSSGSPEAWIMAVWSYRFTEFLKDYVRERDKTDGASMYELQMSDIFVAAQRSGLSLVGERFSNGRFLDVGTPDALVTASRYLSRDQAIW